MTIADLHGDKIDIDPETGCWNWVGAKARGYGHVRHEGRAVLSHRLAFELANGTIDDDLDVLHTCDNPACVNADHLWQGTAGDNANDRSKKGRSASKRGTLNGRARLTELDIPAIRTMLMTGKPIRDIADQYGVSYSTIVLVKNRKNWGWVE